MSKKYERESARDGFPVKHKATDPPPVRGTIIERGRTPLYALGWRMKSEDYRIIHGNPSLAGIWDCFVVPKWHAGPVKTYPIQYSPRTILRGNEILFYLCVNSNEPKMKYVMENLEGLSKMARQVLMLPDDLPDEDELMWRRITVL